MAHHQLTKTKADSARPKPGGAENALSDGAGLYLRVRPSREPKGAPVKQWMFVYKVAGQRRKIGLGGYPEVSLVGARAAAAKYRDMIGAGITPSGERHKAHAESAAPAIPRTVGELAAKWHEVFLAQRHADKGAAVAAAFARHIEPVIGRVKLLDVRKMHVLHVVDPLLRDGKSRTAVGALALLRQMFRWGISRDYMAHDPTLGLNKRDYGGRARPRERHLSEAELVDLAARLRTTHRGGPAGREMELPALAYPTQAAVWVMLGTLARVGELSKARWANVDLAKREWRIPAEDSKNRRPHLIHLSAFAARHFGYLRAYAGDSEFVLPDRTGAAHIDEKAITKQLADRQQASSPDAKPRLRRSGQRSALLLAGGPFSSHDLRRTGATMMQALSVPMEVREKCLNHTEADELVAVYNRDPMLPQRQEAFAKLGARLDKLVPAKATAHLARPMRLWKRAAKGGAK